MQNCGELPRALKRPILLFSSIYTQRNVKLSRRKESEMSKISIFVIVGFFLAGCSSMSIPEGKTPYASYIGDQYSLSMNEVVVSVPIAGKPEQYQNLHVFFAAIINTEKSSWDQYEVASIIRRSSTRLSSVIVHELSELGEISVKNLPSIRKQLVSQAQQAFDSSFSKWTRSVEFKVEIVIVSFFLTDGSVGKTTRNRFWWH